MTENDNQTQVQTELIIHSCFKGIKYDIIYYKEK